MTTVLFSFLFAAVSTLTLPIVAHMHSIRYIVRLRWDLNGKIIFRDGVYQKRSSIKNDLGGSII